MGQTECKSAKCAGFGNANPQSDTVKVNTSVLRDNGKGKENQSPHQQHQAEEDKRQREEKERLEREAAEERAQEEQRFFEQQRIQAQEEAERKRKEQEEEEMMEIQRQENLKARQQAEMERRRQQEEEDAERRRQEQLQREAEQKEREQQQQAKAKVAEFLKAQKFDNVNAKRRRMLKSSYPLHAAVEQKNATVVEALLRCGADPKLKNSSGLTPRQLAEKLNKKGSHDVIMATLVKV